jgi:hypothetical protein
VGEGVLDGWGMKFEHQWLADSALTVHHGPIKMCHATIDQPCQQRLAAWALPRRSVPLEAARASTSRRGAGTDPSAVDIPTLEPTLVN